MYSNIFTLLSLLDQKDKLLLIKYGLLALIITFAEILALSSVIPILGLILNDSLVTGYALQIINFFKFDFLLIKSYQIFFFLYL